MEAVATAAEAAQYAQIIDALLLEEPLFLDVDSQVAEEVHDALQRLIHVDSVTVEQGDSAASEVLDKLVSDHTDGDSEDAAAVNRDSSSRKRVSAVVAAATTTATAKSGTSADGGGAHKKPKARKSTHALRKEEKTELQNEVAALQERLWALEGQRGSATNALVESQLNNAILRESLRGQQLSLATAQCVVSGLLNAERSNPVSTMWIRLGSDWEERRNTLLGMKDQAIRHGCEYIGARSRFLDPLKRHISEERFENAGGDYCCARYDVRQFTNVSSVKQVYDAFLTYMLNIEIIVSERLGTITTRDEFDSVENSVSNYRFLTTEHGVPTEKHGVLFMQFFESHELANGGPCGVIVMDRVEEDELYPYTPHESMRKDLSGAVVLTPHWRAKADGTEGQELVVTMSMGKFIKLHHSECPLATPEVVEKMRENVSGWGDVMVPVMQDILYRGSQFLGKKEKRC